MEENAKPSQVAPVDMSAELMAGKAMQSPALGKLGLALAKAQAQIGTATKDREAEIRSDKGTYRYNYADLASVWEAIRVPLASNELSIIQQVANDARSVTITTTLLHSSGEFIRDRCSLPVTDQRPQSLGSAITYARRYSLSALVGVATEDDDGAAAGTTSKSSAQQAYESRREKAQEKKAAAPEEKKEAPAPTVQARAGRLWKRLQANGWTEETWKNWVGTVLGESKPSATLSPEEMGKLEAAAKDVGQ